MAYFAPKGVFDIVPGVRDQKELWRDSALWIQVEEILRRKSSLYGFEEIRTPVFEKTELFFSLGEFSDIVKKETYTFPDKKGRSLTLRPEGTAAVLRAFIENKLYEGRKESKLFYLLPMFRYERQQAGRFRQHHQFGAESIGCKHPYRDAEIMYLLWDIYNTLGLENLVLHINSLGNLETRQSYEKALKLFLSKRYDDLSELSRERFDGGHILRILDSKEVEDQSIIEEAPVLKDFLDKESQSYFSSVLDLLKSQEINYHINDRLVRGLDYYTDIIFEVTAPVSTAHNSIGGGGRYDGLSSRLHGPDLAACGFGTGLERIIQTLIAQKREVVFKKVFLKILPLSVKFEQFILEWIADLRRSGIAADVDLTRRDLKNMVKSAAAENVTYVVVVGDNEITNDQFILKNMRQRTQEIVSQRELKERLIAYEIQNA